MEDALRVAVYSIALNEAVEVPGWDESTREADYRLVVDTGSTDNTVQLLRDAGIHVAHAAIKPWRFDDARNVALNLLPADIDVCFSLDMDERPRTGWREALDRVWQPDTQLLYHQFHSSRTKSYYGCRFHSRDGFRWTGAYHEVIYWRGEHSYNTATTDDIVIEHFPRGKPRPDDLPLLRESARESPHDNHRCFLYASALLAHGRWHEATPEIERFMALGGGGDRLAFLWRQVAQLDEANAATHLENAQQAHRSASNYLALAEHYLRSQEWGLCYLSCQYAFSRLRSAPQETLAWSDDERLRSPLLHDLAATAAWHLWDYEAAYGHAVEAVRRAPSDRVLINRLLEVHAKIKSGATLDPGMIMTPVAQLMGEV
jgi:hypothetical protein